MSKKVNLFLIGLITMVALCIGFSSCSRDDDGGNSNNGGNGQNGTGEFSPQQIVGKWKYYAYVGRGKWNLVDGECKPTKLCFNADGTLRWDEGSDYCDETLYSYHYLWEIKGKGSTFGTNIVSGSSYEFTLKGNPNVVSGNINETGRIDIKSGDNININGYDINNHKLQFWFQGSVDTLVLRIGGERMYVREQ